MLERLLSLEAQILSILLHLLMLHRLGHLGMRVTGQIQTVQVDSGHMLRVKSLLKSKHVNSRNLYLNKKDQI